MSDTESLMDKKYVTDEYKVKNFSKVKTKIVFDEDDLIIKTKYNTIIYPYTSISRWFSSKLNWGVEVDNIKILFICYKSDVTPSILNTAMKKHINEILESRK